mgnify:CR=1 FL=1
MNERTYKIEIYNKIMKSKKCNSIKAVTLFLAPKTIDNLEKKCRIFDKENREDFLKKKIEEIAVL